MDIIKCPHCGYERYWDKTEGYDIGENKVYCYGCGEEFVLSIEAVYSLKTYKTFWGKEL